MKDVWVFIVAPLIGGSLSAVFYSFITADEFLPNVQQEKEALAK